MTTPPDYPIVQVAYFVPDVYVAAEQMHRAFGAGPFFVSKNIELESAFHRGEECLFVHTSAYGQWGEVMLELVQQDSEGPSPFRDLYRPGESGLHHVATMVPNQKNAYSEYDAAGYEIACIAHTKSGVEFAFVDAIKSLGHFIEVYESTDQLKEFYGMVKNAAKSWDRESTFM